MQDVGEKIASLKQGLGQAKTIKDVWDTFSKAIIPAHAGAIQRDAMCDAFYGGVACALELLIKATELGDVKAGSDAIGAIHAELSNYTKAKLADSIVSAMTEAARHAAASKQADPAQRTKVIRVDGTEEEFFEKMDMRKISDLIHADTLDTVNLRNGKVMIVDDIGVAKNLPINEKATRLYHEVCRPGTTHPIRGDVAIVPDSGN